MKLTAILATALMAGGVYAADTDSGANLKRIRESANVLHEIMEAPDKGIPQNLLEKARCVGVIPSLKRAGFIVGGKYGKGVLTCRVNNGVGWSAPSTVILEGGNVGLQIGAGETDLVFIVMNPKGEQDLTKDKFTIGGEANAMAGPVGRDASAETDAMLRAEILAYSRSRGVFAGVTLDGASLRPDNEDNHELYGRQVTQAAILHGEVKPPASADALYAELNRYAPAHS